MIRQVLVYPQAQIIQQNPRAFVVDIGGFTTDVLLLRGVQPDMQFCRSLEMGAIPMANGIIGRVSALHDIKIDDDHIADVIQGRPTILPDDVQETIRATVKKLCCRHPGQAAGTAGGFAGDSCHLHRRRCGAVSDFH